MRFACEAERSDSLADWRASRSSWRRSTAELDGIDGPSAGPRWLGRDGPTTEDEPASYERVLLPVSIDRRTDAAASRSACEALAKDQGCEVEMEEGREAGEMPL